MRLKERDYKVLEALEKWGALGLGQIDARFYRKPEDPKESMRLYFNEIDRRDYWLGAYKRMKLLERQGLVRLESYINHHQVYLLTAAGHRELYSRGRSKLRSFRPNMPEMFVDHELATAAIGLIIEASCGKRVLSHRQLYETQERDQHGRTRSEVLPDLWIADKESPCAVEVELCQKSAKRYAAHFEEYRRYLPLRGKVLYLTGWSGLRDTLLKLAAGIRFPGLYAASLEEFKAAPGLCSFRAATGNRFQLAPYPEPVAVTA